MALINKQGDLAKNKEDAPKIEFPCDDYMVKIVAVESQDLLQALSVCIERHVPDVDHGKATTNRSSKGRFISYTYRIRATGEQQLSALHKDLMSHTAVKMVL
ncbi:DUF493 domain-containing protein [Marinomonas agarivorans]|nr:DUF493 domain-containing protein [Marinomonas agarivorans]